MNKKGWAILMSLILIVLFIGNIVLGSVRISVAEALQILMGNHSTTPNAFIIWHLRLPTAITAVMAGMALSLAGLLMQTFFRNPLAGPSVLGISSGAGLGVALLIMAMGSMGLSSVLGSVAITGAAFIGALLVFIFIVFLSKYLTNDVSLLIVGLMLGYLTSAVVGVLSFYANAQQLQQFVIWGLGSFSGLSSVEVIILTVCTLLSISATFFITKSLNAWLLGYQYAYSLGVQTKRTRYFMLSIAALLTGVVTAFCGPIAFIGLAVPHFVKIVLKTTNHFILLPFCLLFGAVLALLCNVLASLPYTQAILPINSVTALIGAPLVIYFLLKRNKSKT